ncbi:MAG: glycosyltransferase family 2 protein [Muribaculaceae bacterium]|nr:glycosyltransferase family 2 protein [Muribaculaceae bacterium]
MKTAVVILNWNGAALLRQYLPSVTAGTDPASATVIVADNGSTDDSIALLKNEFPQVEILAFSENHGFAEGYNKAIAILADRFEYIVLLNSDVAVRPGWINPLVDYLDANPDCAAVQPKLLSDTRRSHFEYAGASGGFIDRNGYPYCRGRIFNVCEKDNGQYDKPIDVMWASGAALTVRSRVYLECGGLDKDFFAHMEEIDLCWRMRLAGWRLAVVPQSVVYHLGGGSLPAENPRKTYLNFRNNLLMLHKNLPDSSRNATLLRRRLLDTIAWAKYVATFDFKNAAAIWRAHRDFAHMRHNYDSMPRPSADLIKDRPDILVQYYLRRRKTFDSL